jgi:hypothetical protein
VTLRLAAAAAWLVGAALLLAYLHALDKGPFVAAQPAHQRAMKDRTAVPAEVTPHTFADMAALPIDRPIAEYAVIEARAVSLEGDVQNMFRARDGDYHLDLSPEPADPAAPMHYYSTAEITPQFHGRSSTWRFERLAAALRPTRGAGDWDRPARRMRLTGWLMYDHEHGAPPPGVAWPVLLSQWEIHPVTRIEVWDDARAAFVEIPR